MSQIAKHYELVRHHALAGLSYDADLPDGVRNGLNHEMERLEKFAPVEYAITRRYLLRFIPEGAIVADVGVGAGHYSELLARRGSNIHLVDVASRLLGAAQERLTKTGLQEHMQTIAATKEMTASLICLLMFQGRRRKLPIFAHPSPPPEPDPSSAARTQFRCGSIASLLYNFTQGGGGLGS